MFKEELSLVPHKPGSYQMKDKSGTVIYVGKAKDLKNRLSSYFTGRVTGKTKKMVENVDHFEYIVTSSELEAFILEINLIKKYDPKYNILLRDDKSYPYIEYVSKPYPTLKVVRYLTIKKNKDKHLFGPYVNAYAARRIVNLLNRLYPLKKCNGCPKEVCLYYHIHECLGYCTKKVDQDKITSMENDILSFLNGNDDIIINKIEEQIKYHASILNYEVAKELKDELDYIKIVMQKQKVELHDLVNRDIINYYYHNGYVAIEIFFIRNGKLLGGKNEVLPVTDDVESEVENYIAMFYQKSEIPREIITNEDLDLENLSNILNTNVIYVSRGDKHKLLNLAYENAKMNLENQMKTIEREIERTSGANEELEDLLGIKIHRIESFDNSHLFGTNAVSGMVVFLDGHPSKKDYRKYKVSVDKNDDYHTMKEVTYRRYFRSLIDKTDLPDLILADGGEAQVHAIKDTLEELHLNIKVCGMVKNDKHMTNMLLDGDTFKTYELDHTSDLFHYITRIQDEVHRFTITYHRTLRSKSSIASILDNIDGVGENRRKELIKEFKNVKNISNASIEELERIVPTNVAHNIKAYLKEFNESKNKE